MKRFNILSLLTLSLVLAASCDDDYMAITNPDAGKGRKADVETREYILHPLDWVSAADSISAAFVERFYCSTERRGEIDVFSYTSYNNRGDNGSCYWQQAHAMAAMVDWYLRIKESNPNQAAVLKDYMSRWFAQKGNNYAASRFRGSAGFGNNYTDDTAWNTLALLQMFEATGDQRYFEAAESTWKECIRTRFPLNEYGWLIWILDAAEAGKSQKEADQTLECTNGPSSIIASMLARYAKDAGNEEAYQEYLQEAYRCFDQNLSVMSPLGTLGNIPLSYTQGTCMEAGRLIWHLTGETGYLKKAIMAARAQMSEEMCEVYNGEFLMRNEGADYNNAIFHAVFYHWASRMVLDRDIDAVDPTIRKELQIFIKRHCWYYWTRGVDKKNWNDSYFSTWTYRPRALGSGGELGAYASAAQAMEAMCLINGEKL